uniref:Uncharacterized protein n=2 Tax=Lutzomyia longipalpis TaxID=7200 RepID=A0A1B0EZX0_LUTLO
MPSRSATESHSQQLYGFPLILYSLLLRVAATLFGQLLLHLGDRLLWTVENLTYWSIPSHRLAEFTNSPQTPLVRPLSWWLFLPSLLWLRLIRKGLTIVLWFIGYEPVTPISMVQYIQTQRNRIQAIKQSGVQTIRKRREESAKKAGLIRGILLRIQKLFYLIFLHFEDEEVKTQIVQSEKPVNNEEEKEESTDGETELTLAELLEKYTNMEDNEENDPDYIPNEESSSTEEDCSGEEDEEDETIDEVELQDLFNKENFCDLEKLTSKHP